MEKSNNISAVIIEDDDDCPEFTFNVNMIRNNQYIQEKQPQEEHTQEEQTQEEQTQEEQPQEKQPQEEQTKENNKKQKQSRAKKVNKPLNKYFDEDTTLIEIGIDEVGRGPMFGRVYASAVILPKDDNFDHSQIKDSKKFTSEKKIKAVAEYIKENAIAWSVKYEDEDTIDRINILQATQHAMHRCISDILTQLKRKNNIQIMNSNLLDNNVIISNDKDTCINTDSSLNLSKILLMVDGNYFKPYIKINKNSDKIETIRHITIEQGDNKYTSIAAASILAKVERDAYIDRLCEEHPELKEKYKIDSNKGYGSKAHLDGIKQWGITVWHRKTFGICKNYA